MKIILFIVLFLFSGCNIEFGTAGTTQIEIEADNNETNETVVVDDTNESDVTNDVSIVNENLESDFDQDGAILDNEACGAFDGYFTIKDNSFDPEGFYDDTNGITLGSSYPMSFNPNDTEVVLFYKQLTETKTGIFSNIYEDNYYLSFDQAWIKNSDRTIYLKTPKLEATNNKYGCYRYELNSIDSTINRVKVYRFN